MSKSKIAAQPKTSADSKVSNLARLNAGIKQIAEKGLTMRGAVGVGLVLLAICFFHVLAGAKVATAMLYLIADNGKKSGRADGNVYMRNGRIRGFKVPAIVRNAYTSIARTNLASLSGAWNGLTNFQRQTWLDVGNIFRSDRFGRQVLVKGKQLFVLCNTNLLNAAEAAIDAFPLVVNPPLGLTSFSGAAAFGAGTHTLAFTGTPIGADEKLLIFATAPQRAGVYRPSESAYRLIVASAAAQASPFNIAVAYNNKFGAPPELGKIFTRAIVVNTSSGLVSAKTQCDYVVAA